MQSRVQKSPTNRMVKLLMILTRYRVVLYASPLTYFINAGSKQWEPRGTTSVYEECGNVSFCFPPPDSVSARSPLIENFLQPRDSRSGKHGKASAKFREN